MKLVRDRIPELVAAAGETEPVRLAGEKRARCGGFEGGVVWLGGQNRPYDMGPTR